MQAASLETERERVQVMESAAAAMSQALDKSRGDVDIRMHEVGAVLCSVLEIRIPNFAWTHTHTHTYTSTIESSQPCLLHAVSPIKER